MKKLSYVILPIAFLAYTIKGNDQEADTKKIADDSGIIKCTIVIYKDRHKGHDRDAWEEVIKRTIKWIDIAKNEEGKSPKDDDIMEQFMDLLDHTYGQVKMGTAGIHGEISLATSNGQETRCCGGVCSCADRYAGNCPCELAEISMCNARNNEKSSCCRTANADDAKKSCCQKAE